MLNGTSDRIVIKKGVCNISLIFISAQPAQVLRNTDLRYEQSQFRLNAPAGWLSGMCLFRLLQEYLTDWPLCMFYLDSLRLTVNSLDHVGVVSYHNQTIPWASLPEEVY